MTFVLEVFFVFFNRLYFFLYVSSGSSGALGSRCGRFGGISGKHNGSERYGSEGGDYGGKNLFHGGSPFKWVQLVIEKA